MVCGLQEELKNIFSEENYAVYKWEPKLDLTLTDRSYLITV